MMKKARYLFIAAILLVDQISKYVIRTKMFLGQSIPLLEGVFHITYVQNRGAAFNTFDGMQTFLQVVSLGALAVAIWYMERHLSDHWTLLLSLVLVISGGIGNLIDRLALGYVTDLFDFCLIDFPVFNVADIAICVGCGLLVLFMFCFDKNPQESREIQEAAGREAAE